MFNLAGMPHLLVVCFVLQREDLLKIIYKRTKNAEIIRDTE